MAEFDPSRTVRRVRRRLKVSQEGLSRLLNATKGAIQHWERGRNRPDLGRLLALRELCPPGLERKELDGLIRHTQSRVSPLSGGGQGKLTLRGGARGIFASRAFATGGLEGVRRENERLNRKVGNLKATLERKSERLRVLENLAKDLQNEVSKLRSGQSPPRPN